MSAYTAEEWRRRLREDDEYEQRRLAEFEQGLRHGESWGVALAAVSEGLDGHLPGMLYRLWRSGSVADDRLAEVVADVWIHNRSPVSGLSMRRWAEMYRASGFVTRCVDGVRMGDVPILAAYEHLHFEKQPTEPLTLYRGAGKRSQGRGMSWTLHQECAEDFAVGNLLPEDNRPTVFRATVPGRAVLAVFCDEREQEIVVNPSMLTGRAAPEAVAETKRLRAGVAENKARRARIASLFADVRPPE